MDEQRLLGERLKILYMQAPISNVVVAIIGVLFFALLRDTLGVAQTTAWTVLLVCLAAARTSVWWRYARRPESHSSQYWLNSYVLFTALLGLAWSLAYLLLPQDPQVWVVSVMFLLYFSLIVSAYAILSIDLPAFVLYTLPSAITFTYTLLRQDVAWFPGMFITAPVFYAMLLLVAINTHRQMIKTIRLELSNARLIDRLKQEVSQRDHLVAEQTDELAEMHHVVSQSETQLRNVITGANLGFWDWEYQTGRHQVNDRWLEMLGLQREDINNDVSDWEARIHPDDKQRMIDLVQEHIRNHSSYVADFRMRHKDGHWVWIQGSGAVVEYDDQGQPVRLSGTHQEISSRKVQEERLAYQASHDVLTGLLNRAGMLERLESEINRAQRHNEQLAVFMLDIDHFKHINDTHGHRVGDLVLRAFAGILSQQVRKMDVAIRYGGEEFTIILPETERSQALEMAERLRSLVAQQEHLIDGRKIRFTISIGVACYPRQADTANGLIEAADRALYQAKHAGRNRVQVAGEQP